MSKPNSGHFKETTGARNACDVPGTPGEVTGGSSQKLGKNMMQAMGLRRSTKWKGYQAQHIIPVELRSHPVLKKIGFDLDDASNGIFLRKPSNTVSATSRHSGYHAPYNRFVEKMLDNIDINSSTNTIRSIVKSLQTDLRKMQQSGIVLYPKQGASVELYERTFKRMSAQKGT
ncbi:MAG: AHH domain-containing protein [Eubacterium sp.]|nr:AHH domain-containing protein [Eubacterium sp.]